MTITPVQHEPDRFWVSSATSPDGPPHMVDVRYYPDGRAGCSCPSHMVPDEWFECKHIRAVKEWLKTPRHQKHEFRLAKRRVPC